MRRRVLTVAAVLLGAVALGWLLRFEDSSDDRSNVAVDAPAVTSPSPEMLSQPPVRPDPKRFATPFEPVVQAPVDVASREHFNEQAREYFANAPQMSAEQRLQEARLLEQELTRLEQAGGMSAGETLLIRAGLIRETVPAGAQQDAQLQALREDYRVDTQRRVASAQARPDPQFESYKVRENEIVSEVMAMETIPDGLSRDEYLRQRLQSAREQLTPQ